jgi:hypothetical protein
VLVSEGQAAASSSSISVEQFEALKTVEQSERDILMRLVGEKITRKRSRR